LVSRLALKIVVMARGNRQQATGNRQEARVKRQQATGNRQQATGKSKEVFSDFTFLYTVWFYCVF